MTVWCRYSVVMPRMPITRTSADARPGRREDRAHRGRVGQRRHPGLPGGEDQRDDVERHVGQAAGGEGVGAADAGDLQQLGPQQAARHGAPSGVVAGQREEDVLQVGALLAQLVQLGAGPQRRPAHQRRVHAEDVQRAVGPVPHAGRDDAVDPGRQRRAQRGRLRGPDHDVRTASGDELGQRAGPDQPAAGQDHDVVDGLLDLGQDVAGHQDRPTLGRAVAQEAAQPGDPLRVQPVGRLVQDQDRRVAEQRAGQAEPLPHAAGVGADAARAGIGQADQLEHLVGPPVRQAAGAGHHPQVVASGAAGVEARRLQRGAHRADRVVEVGVRPAVDRRGARRRA